MTTLELGAVVQFSQTYSRHGKYRIGYDIDKYWRRNDDITRTGIVVGIRTISNGTRKWVGSEEGYEYTPTEYLQAALVAFDLRRKPVLVPIDAVQVVNPTGNSYTVFWSDEDSGYIAACPNFKGLSGFGTTATAALYELNTAISIANQE